MLYFSSVVFLLQIMHLSTFYVDPYRDIDTAFSFSFYIKLNCILNKIYSFCFFSIASSPRNLLPLRLDERKDCEFALPFHYERDASSNPSMFLNLFLISNKIFYI